MKRTEIIAVLLASSLVAFEIPGQTIRDRMNVSATVVTNCRLVIPPLSFGIYDPLAVHGAQPADASVDVTLNCTRNTTAAISFDSGLHSGKGTARAMNGPGTDLLQYQIYRDAARSQIWSQGGGAMRLLTQGVARPDQLTVFGRIPARQEVEPGVYSDVLTATVDF